jgi:uncharacterized membrane protein affecting hemolysin expression
MKMNDPLAFLAEALPPGATVFDVKNDEWLVLDAVSYSKKGTGLARLKDGRYRHSLQIDTYPLYTDWTEQFVEKIITWFRRLSE